MVKKMFIELLKISDENKELLLIVLTLALCAMFVVYKLINKRVIRKPGKVSFTCSQGEFGMLQFCLCLPEQSCHDVVSRELTVSVGGAEPVVFTLEANASEQSGFEGLHGDLVAGSLVDVDAAGNRSEPSVFSFTLVDTFPPPAPGEVGLKVTGQTHPEPVEPEPTPEPTPEPAPEPAPETDETVDGE